MADRGTYTADGSSDGVGAFEKAPGGPYLYRYEETAIKFWGIGPTLGSVDSDYSVASASDTPYIGTYFVNLGEAPDAVVT